MTTSTFYFVSSVSGNVSTPNNAIGNTPTTWTTDANANISWTHRWRLDTAAGNFDAVGTQTITLRMRKGSNSGNPTVSSVTLFQAGVSLGALTLFSGSTTISSTTGQNLVYTFDGALLSDLVDVDIEIATVGVGGPVSARNAASIATGTWEATYNPASVVATMAAQETGSDIFSGSASVSVQAALTAQEVGGDTFAATASVAVSAALAAQEVGSDIASMTLTVNDPGITAILAAQETGPDVLAATAQVAIDLSLAAQETGADLFSGDAFVNISASLSAQETGADVFSATAGVAVDASLVAVEAGADAFASSVAVSVVANMAAQESGSDTAAMAAAVAVAASMSVQETGADLFSGSLNTIQGVAFDLAPVMYFITRQMPRRKRLEVIPLAFLADPVPQPVATTDQVFGGITLKANKFSKSERWLLDTVPLAFLADQAPNPDDKFAGGITLKANRVSRKVKRLDVQPYDAWLGFGIAQLTMPIIGNFDTNAILHPGWLIYVTSGGSPTDVYADNVANQTHATPVKLDRHANTPVMWVDSALTYDITIKNEFGVLRYTATGITV